MSKIFIRLTQLVLVLLFVFLFLAKTTLAVSCTFTYYKPTDVNSNFPIKPSQDMGDLVVHVTSPSLPDGTYRLQLIDPEKIDYHVENKVFKTTEGAWFTIPHRPGGWVAGTNNLYFIEQGKLGEPEKIKTCKDSFIITDIPAQPSCVASIESKPIDPTVDVVLVMNNIDRTRGNYDIYINNELKLTYSTTVGTRIQIGKFPEGAYTVTIKSKDDWRHIQCNAVNFTVAPYGSGGGGQTGTGTPAEVCSLEDIRLGRCSSGGGKEVEGCSKNPKDNNYGIATAIGCIHTNPAALAKDLLTFVIGISGGLAFLLMLLGAFQMLTSAGNPETLNAGRERLTSAVIGLLFVIFAVLLLQIIGWDILRLEGFGR